jgi:hypothetical protein
MINLKPLFIPCAQTLYIGACNTACENAFEGLLEPLKCNKDLIDSG